ncbi:translation protein SH3-like domain-containing protein [Phlyctochytrium arcticum]|nr:translation protein SH3-like domain-containing protein [Phlyctochytrium arcticum]
MIAVTRRSFSLASIGGRLLPARTLPLCVGSGRSYAAKAKPAQEAEPESPLPPFFPRDLTDSQRARSQELETSHGPRGVRQGARLMQSISNYLVNRLDVDGREQLMRGGSASGVEPGSVLMVEYITSRSRPRTQIFAGVLVAIRRKDVMTNIILRNYVLGTGVEMVFPIFSPNIKSIKVLKKVTGVSEGDNIYWLRDKPSSSPVAFTKIDEMVVRDREQDRRAKKLQGHTRN